MAKKKINPNAAFILYNVIYQDGAQTSNRRVPPELVGGLDGEAPIKAFLEGQDREIAEKSGRPRGPIKTISRVPGQ
jgi:hypothetical protein